MPAKAPADTAGKTRLVGPSIILAPSLVAISAVATDRMDGGVKPATMNLITAACGTSAPGTTLSNRVFVSQYAAELTVVDVLFVSHNAKDDTKQGPDVAVALS